MKVRLVPAQEVLAALERARPTEAVRACAAALRIHPEPLLTMGSGPASMLVSTLHTRALIAADEGRHAVGADELVAAMSSLGDTPVTGITFRQTNAHYAAYFLAWSLDVVGVAVTYDAPGVAPRVLPPVRTLGRDDVLALLGRKGDNGPTDAYVNVLRAVDDQLLTAVEMPAEDAAQRLKEHVTTAESAGMTAEAYPEVLEALRVRGGAPVLRLFAERDGTYHWLYLRPDPSDAIGVVVVRPAET